MLHLNWYVHLEPQIWPRILNSPLFCPSRHSRQILDFQNTQGIIFVVDSNDRERVSEAREELQRMLNEDELRDALLLVFANKQDLPNAMNAAEITDKLGLHSLRQRQWWVFPQRLLLSKFAERNGELSSVSKLEDESQQAFFFHLDPWWSWYSLLSFFSRCFFSSSVAGSSKLLVPLVEMVSTKVSNGYQPTSSAGSKSRIVELFLLWFSSLKSYYGMRVDQRTGVEITLSDSSFYPSLSLPSSPSSPLLLFLGLVSFS